jgi:hypothetical protein
MQESIAVNRGHFVQLLNVDWIHDHPHPKIHWLVGNLSYEATIDELIDGDTHK